jgi:hypothetical protein
MKRNEDCTCEGDDCGMVVDAEVTLEVIEAETGPVIVKLSHYVCSCHVGEPET